MINIDDNPIIYIIDTSIKKISETYNLCEKDIKRLFTKIMYEVGLIDNEKDIEGDLITYTIDMYIKKISESYNLCEKDIKRLFSETLHEPN